MRSTRNSLLLALAVLGLVSLNAGAFAQSNNRSTKPQASSKHGAHHGGGNHNPNPAPLEGPKEYRYSVIVYVNSFIPLRQFDDPVLDPLNEFQLTAETIVGPFGDRTQTKRVEVDFRQKRPGDEIPAFFDAFVYPDLELLDGDEILVTVFGEEIDVNFLEGPGDRLQEISIPYVFDSQVIGKGRNIDLVFGDDARTYQVKATLSFSRKEFAPGEAPAAFARPGGQKKTAPKSAVQKPAAPPTFAPAVVVETRPLPGASRTPSNAAPSRPKASPSNGGLRQPPTNGSPRLHRRSSPATLKQPPASESGRRFR